MKPKDYYPWPSDRFHIKEVLALLESAPGRASLQFELTNAIKNYLRANCWIRAPRVGGFHFPGIAISSHDDPNAREIIRIYNILLDDSIWVLHDPEHSARHINIYYRAYRSARKQIRDEERRSRQ